MVVRRLPRLRDDNVTPQAFAGTFHVTHMEPIDAAYSQAASGRLLIPYLRSLPPADRLEHPVRPVARCRAQTLTVPGLQYQTRCSATPKA